MNVKITRHDLDELRRIRDKVDSINGPGVKNSPRSVTINNPQAPARPQAASGSFMFPIKVEKTDGSDGTSTSKANWKYTARSIEWNGTSGGSTLGTLKEPKKPRRNGKVTVQSGSTGYGVGFIDETGTFQIWDAGEVYTPNPC